jgi:putative phage-type endonuclease
VNVFLDVEQRTEKWLALRQSGPAGNPYPVAVGASEIADAIGLNGAEAQRLLWARKSGIAPYMEANWAMQRGIAMEPYIRAEYEKRYQLNGGPMLAYDDRWPFILASLDWISDDRSVVAEFKLHNAEAHAMARSGRVPEVNRAQLQAQLLCSGAEVNHLVSLGSEGDMAMVVCLPEPESSGLPWMWMVEEAARFCEAVRDGREPDWPASEGRRFAWGIQAKGGAGRALAGAPIETAAGKALSRKGEDVPRGNELFTLPGGAKRPAERPDAAQDASGDAAKGVGSARGQTLALGRIRPIDEPAEVERLGPAGAINDQPGDAIVQVPTLGPARPQVLLAHFFAERDSLIASATAIVVSDDQTEQQAVAMQKELTSISSRIESAKLAATKPFRDVVAAINAAAEEFCLPLLDAKAYVNRQLVLRADAKRIAADLARRDAARKQAEAAAEAARLRALGQIEAAEEVIAEAKSKIVLPDSGPLIKGGATSREPSYEITDPDAVAREFCTPDPKKIKARMTEVWKAFKGDEARFAEWAGKQAGLTFHVETKTKAR